MILPPFNHGNLSTRRKFIAAVTILTLLATGLQIKFALATAPACSSSASAQNGITVVPSHGQVFYLDTGTTPVLDAGYIGYRVTNGTGSTQSNLWTQVSNFSGGVISLSNPLDSAMQLSSLANSATGTSYFLLKGTGATTSAQSHTVRIYNGRPDLAGSSLLYECTFTFSKVQEAIKAASNKVANNGLNTSDAIEVNDTTPELGQTLVITVEGQTGVIGNGSSPDGSIVWLTPAAISSWPTRALRLESVSVVFDTNRNWNTAGDQVTYTNQLLITNAKNTVSNSEYRATYTYRVVGLPQSTVQVVPVAEIASGTQIKHADTTATGATIDLSFSTTQINASLAKTVTSTTGLTTVTCSSSCTVPGGTDGATYVAVPYRLQATTTTATTVKLDEFVDTPATGVIFKPGSATITDIGRSSATIADPVYVTSEELNTPRPIHFIGPFTLSSATAATLNYTMWVPVGTYANTAYAKLGDTSLGVNPTAASLVTVTSTGTSSVTVEVSTVSLGAVAITDPATNIATTSARLNGTVDPNGTTPLTGTFEYGTNSNLAGATTVTATTPASGTLSGLTDPTTVSVNVTGLSANTTYYYRAVAGSVTGEILSFTTLAVVSSPTVIATTASNLTVTTATLNGTINPNLTAVTGIQFIYGTSSSLSSGNTTATQDDGSGTAALTAGGSSTQTFSQDITSLTGGTTYYYKLRACTSTLTGTYPNVTCSSFVDSSIVSFIASAVPTATTQAASNVGASTAVLNGSVNANFASTSVTFEYGTSPTLSSGTVTASAGTATGGGSTSVNASISGLLPSTTYYFRVIGTNSVGMTNGSILDFTTSAVNRTLTIDTDSYEATYGFADASPTIHATPSAGAGAITYSSLTTGVCTINSSSGTVAFVTTGTCTIGASIAADTSFTDASASPVSFSIIAASRFLDIDADSYASSYVFTATPPTLTATPSAGSGEISFTSTTPSVCGVGALTGTVSFTSVGTCTIYAEISASGGYDSATASAVSFDIQLAARTLTIDSSSFTSPYALTATPPTITSTVSAGAGAKTFSSITSSVCSIDESTGTVTFVAAGTCTIGAAIASDGQYEQADADTISFSIVFADRTLVIDPETYTSTYERTDSPPTIHATPSVGAGTITYTSSTLSVCTVDSTSGEVAFVSTGTCTLRADIGADDDYSATISDPVSFSITLAPRTIEILETSYDPSYPLNETGPVLTSSPSAGDGTKTYTSATPDVCTVDATSGAVTLQSAGTCTISVGIDSDEIYIGVTSADISFTVTLVSRTLAIDSASYAASYALAAVAPTITATPSAGTGTKTFSSSTPAVCIVDAGTGLVTFVSAGTCTVGADIAATSVYQSASASSISFLIESSSPHHGGRSRVSGCTNSSATNYKPTATEDDGSCLFDTPKPPAQEPAAPNNADPSDPDHPAIGKQDAVTCAPYLTGFIKLGATNDPEQVRKLQSFLNTYEHESLVVDGTYKAADFEAVKRFQSKYGEILKAWNLTQPTGYVYIATQNVVNKIYCQATTGIVCPYFNIYVQEGDTSPEVFKIKNFLNRLLGLSLDPSSPVFDSSTTSGVKQFQENYASRILTPWGLTHPTGRWYQSSKKTANDLLGCFELIKLDNGTVLQ